MLLLLFPQQLLPGRRRLLHNQHHRQYLVRNRHQEFNPLVALPVNQWFVHRYLHQLLRREPRSFLLRKFQAVRLSGPQRNLHQVQRHQRTRAGQTAEHSLRDRLRRHLFRLQMRLQKLRLRRRYPLLWHRLRGQDVRKKM